MTNRLNLTFSVLAMIFCLQACQQSSHDTFLQTSMCVFDQAGVLKFKDIMRSVAKSENLTFIDGSAETARNLKSIGADKSLGRDTGLAINVGIEGGGTVMVMGGNLGLPHYQVALGYGGGSDPARAHRLSQRLVKAFTERWQVEIVPPDRGVPPIKACGG